MANQNIDIERIKELYRKDLKFPVRNCKIAEEKCSKTVYKNETKEATRSLLEENQVIKDTAVNRYIEMLKSFLRHWLSSNSNESIS